MTLGYRIYLTFNIGLHKKDHNLLLLLKFHWGVGNI